MLTRRFTPNHHAVCPCLKSRRIWAEFSPTFAGGIQCSAKWLKTRYSPYNESQVLALIATDFQNKN